MDVILRSEAAKNLVFAETLRDSSPLLRSGSECPIPHRLSPAIGSRQKS